MQDILWKVQFYAFCVVMVDLSDFRVAVNRRQYFYRVNRAMNQDTRIASLYQELTDLYIEFGPDYVNDLQNLLFKSSDLIYLLLKQLIVVDGTLRLRGLIIDQHLGVFQV